jgi:hypothetical protein
MQDQKNKFKEILNGIVGSTQSDGQKIFAISGLIADLSLVNQNEEISLASETGATLARRANRPEMVAQFCLMRAKSEISQAGDVIVEMKNIKMAIDWCGFALESASDRYKELDKKLRKIWATTQTIIQTGYKVLNEKPYVGATAYCHATAGQIYGSYYLQLKLHYSILRGSWRAKIANYKVVRWFGIDDLFLIDKKSRVHINKVKKDCLWSLHEAIRLFKVEKAHEYVIDTYLDLALEHHSFNSPIRSKFYLLFARILMGIKGPSGNVRLETRLRSLKKLPLIGSDRDINISRSLPKLL